SFSQGWLTTATSADDRHVSLCARRNRTATPTQLRSSLDATTGRLASTSTVGGRLHEGGLYARRPAICMPLMSRHGKERLGGHINMSTGRLISGGLFSLRMIQV
ncbi:hypothetical protein AVEN_20783-1, partial [Araneus ventricosus]